MSYPLGSSGRAVAGVVYGGLLVANVGSNRFQRMDLIVWVGSGELQSLGNIVVLQARRGERLAEKVKLPLNWA